MNKKLAFVLIPLTVLGLLTGLIGCELKTSEEITPTIQAAGNIYVGEIISGVPTLTVTLAEANYYLQQAGNNSLSYSSISIVDAGGEYYLEGETVDNSGNSLNTAISLDQTGNDLYMRLVTKKCTGNPCTSCKFNDNLDGCICNNTESGAKCDYSDGAVSGWTQY